MEDGEIVLTKAIGMDPAGLVAASALNTMFRIQIMKHKY